MYSRSSDHAPEDVAPALRLTLHNLQLKYLDLYLIHWPVSVSKGALWPYPEESNYGYVPERIAKCWQVRMDWLIATLAGSVEFPPF